MIDILCEKIRFIKHKIKITFGRGKEEAYNIYSKTRVLSSYFTAAKNSRCGLEI